LVREGGNKGKSNVVSGGSRLGHPEGKGTGERGGSDQTLQSADSRQSESRGTRFIGSLWGGRKVAHVSIENLGGDNEVEDKSEDERRTGEVELGLYYSK